MINSIKLNITLAFIFLAPMLLMGQNDGIRGYASFEFLNIVSGVGVKDYTTGGGGLIINNNIVLGGYVGTFTKPFRWDVLTATSNSNQDTEVLSTNVDAVNTTISAFDVGARVGFNVAPGKILQSTISFKLGYSTINYTEAYLDTLTGNMNPNIYPISVLNVSRNNFNFSPQIDLQLKIGKAIKFSVLGGYKFHSTRIADKDIFPDIQNLLLDRNLFGGFFGGFGLTFGNL